MRRRWKLLLIGITTLPLLAWGYDRLVAIHWVGHTDLEIEFIVVAESTAEPIEGATIQIRSEGGLNDEREPKRFALTTDPDGVSRRTCTGCMCFGTQSGLRFTNTFVVHIPWWYYQVSAEGFESTGEVSLDMIQNGRNIHRLGGGKSKLTVRLVLKKAST